MEGFRRRPKRGTAYREIENLGGYKTDLKERAEGRERLALRNRVKKEKHFEIYGGLREDIGMKTYIFFTVQWVTQKS